MDDCVVELLVQQPLPTRSKLKLGLRIPSLLGAYTCPRTRSSVEVLLFKNCTSGNF